MTAELDRRHKAGFLFTLAAAVASLVVMIALTGCQSGSPAEQGLAKPAATPATPPVPEISPSDIEVFDARMWPSEARIISSPKGDMRPLYRVAGRIRNNSGIEIGEVKLRISVRDRSETEVDGADISLTIPIPPGSTRAFDKQIQVLPPPNWTWAYEVVSVFPRQ